MSAMKEIRKYVYQLYGNLISVEDPIFDPDKKLWIAKLKVEYPRIITDDSTNERLLRFISMKQLGVIRLTKDFKLEKATTREECVKKLLLFLGMWRERAERIITYASSHRLAKLSEARYVFSPIIMILSNFLQREIITHKQIEKVQRGERIGQYLRLLEGLDLATETEEGYTYGNLFTELRRQSKSVEEFKNAVLSYVIRERYSTLRDVFKTHQFEPYVHVNSCYYRPALEAEKLLYRKPESIIAIYRTLYKKTSTFRLYHVIHSLTEVGALHHERQYLYGDHELFSKMLEMKGRLPNLTTPSVGISKE